MTIFKADEAIKEFYGPRADSMTKKQDMYSKISKYGYIYLNELEGSHKDSQTLNTINTFLLGAGIESDLINSAEDTAKDTLKQMVVDDELKKMNEDTTLNESIIKNKKLAHVSVGKFDVLKPTGLDFGNRFQKAGWSLFCYDAKNVYDIMSWGVYMVVSYCDAIQNELTDKTISNFSDNERFIVNREYYNIIIKNIKKISPFYIYEFEVPINKIGLGNTSSSKEFTVREDITDFKVKTVKVTKDMIDKYITIKTDEEITKTYDSFQDINNIRANKFISNLIWNKDFSINTSQYIELTHDIQDGKLKVGDDVEKYLYNKLGLTLNTRRDHKKFKEEKSLPYNHVYIAITEREKKNGCIMCEATEKFNGKYVNLTLEGLEQFIVQQSIVNEMPYYTKVNIDEVDIAIFDEATNGAIIKLPINIPIRNVRPLDIQIIE